MLDRRSDVEVNWPLVAWKVFFSAVGALPAAAVGAMAGWNLSDELATKVSGQYDTDIARSLFLGGWMATRQPQPPKPEKAKS